MIVPWGKDKPGRWVIVFELCIVLLTLIAWGIRHGWFHLR
jgi:hypothetical protein